MVVSKRTKSERHFEQFVGNLLRVGVMLATALVLAGGLSYLIRHGTEVPNYQFFRGEPAEFRTLTGLETSVLSGRRRSIIQMGLLLLIATPVIRVGFSLLAFIRQKDVTYIVITLIVLLGLVYSLMG
jgi:uncharacterized membrane protein